MTTKQKVARHGLSLRELAQELSNVSRVCCIMGYSRQQFYEIRCHMQTYGSEALVNKLPDAWGMSSNLMVKQERHLFLEHSVAKKCIEVSDEQIWLLGCTSTGF